MMEGKRSRKKTRLLVRTCLDMKTWTYTTGIKCGLVLSPELASLSLSLCSDHEDIGGDAGITEENRAILERVRMNTRQEYLAAGKATGSVRATDRLMRELQDIYRSKNYKSGMVDSSLFVVIHLWLGLFSSW